MRRLAAPQGRIVFVILRTASSPPVAPHPASRRRSFLRLPRSGIISEEDFHLLNRACSQAHSFPRRRESRNFAHRRKPMTIKIYVRSILLGALVTLSLAGFMIHARVHLIAENPSFTVPFVAGILSIAVIPALFWFKKTLAYGYVLNGFLCIIGTVTMG